METITQYADTKNHLEERIRSLEEERSALQRDIESLNEAITIKTLERNAAQLERQVLAFKEEKLGLIEQIGRLSSDDAGSP